MNTKSRRLAALVAALTVTATVLGVAVACLAFKVAQSAEDARTESCPVLVAPTDDPSILAITQAPLEAQRTFALYEFNGVSEDPRVVGHLEAGDGFCFSEEDLDWSVAITEGAGAAPVGLVSTPDHPDSVYSGVIGAIPTLYEQGEEAGHFVIPFRRGQGWIERPSDAPVLPAPVALAVSAGLAGSSQEVGGLRADEVRSLR